MSQREAVSFDLEYRMKLWTWQGRGFSLLDDRVDWEKSKYFTTTVPGARAAYLKLKKRLGTDQYTWCHTKRPPESLIKLEYRDRLEWILDVPCAAIMQFVNVHAWEAILWDTRLSTGNPCDKLFIEAPRSDSNTSAVVPHRCRDEWVLVNPLSPQ